MISTKEALTLIQQNTLPLAPVTLSLEKIAGHTLARDVYAAMDIPAYAQSSMDGYALRFHDWEKNSALEIAGEIPAGQRVVPAMAPQTAMRIFTGAALPNEADTVVMQEKVIIDGNQLIIEDEKLKKGSNVRLQGSEVKSGELTLSEGTSLSPAAIGFLAAMGMNEIWVYPFPRITLLVTGNELIQPGKPIGNGQVYDSSSFAIQSALQQLLFHELKIVYSPDNLSELSILLQQALEYSDMVLITGGVSVGNYDFVLPACEACGVQSIFHKVKQRPGKPLYFGKKTEKLVFGLPGNPASVLTCFYQYVLPALGALSKRNLSLHAIEVPLTRSFQKPGGLTQFLKGFFDGQVVKPLDAQESYRLRSFAIANCLIELPESETEFAEKAIVNIHLLPH